MQAVKDMVSSAKEKVRVCGAKAEEKSAKSQTTSKVEKDMAHENYKAKEAEAKAAKHSERAQHRMGSATATAATGYGAAGHHHNATTAGYGAPGTHQNATTTGYGATTGGHPATTGYGGTGALGNAPAGYGGAGTGHHTSTGYGGTTTSVPLHRDPTRPHPVGAAGTTIAPPARPAGVAEAQYGSVPPSNNYNNNYNYPNTGERYM